MHSNLPLIIALIIMAGMLAQWLAWRLKLPSILFLLILGLALGPLAQVLSPDELFGELLFPAVSLGVALVLFEGALTLRFSDLRGHGPSVSNLVTWGALLNWVLIAGGTWLFTPFDWKTSLLFGSLVVVTGPTVIMPLLRTVKPNAGISNILRWEGILIDPIGALLAVIIFEAMIAGVSDNPWGFLFKELTVGILFGIGPGFFLAQLLKRHWLPEYLHNVFTLALVLMVFALANHFATESGLLAVTVMGIWLANTKGIDIEEILSFKESLSILIISVLFILLAARVDISLIADLGWSAAGVLCVILLARPVMMFLSTWRAELTWQDKTLLSWIAPRGIVAAAVSSLFALKLEQEGFPNAVLLPPLTFLVIIVTVLLQSFTARPLAHWLGVAADDHNGILMVGGNPVAIALGKALKTNGFNVIIATPNWSEAKAARMAGLATYFGNPVSAHADRHLDLVGMGQLMALSRRPALNALSAMKYQGEFGRQRVFTLRTTEENDESEKSRLVDSLRTARLFGEEITIQKLSSLLSQGWEVKTTSLSEEYLMGDFAERHTAKNTLMLFAVDPKGKLRPYTDTSKPEPSANWLLIYLSATAKKAEEAG